MAYITHYTLQCFTMVTSYYKSTLIFSPSLLEQAALFTFNGAINSSNLRVNKSELLIKHSIPKNKICTNFYYKLQSHSYKHAINFHKMVYNQRLKMDKSIQKKLDNNIEQTTILLFHVILIF